MRTFKNTRYSGPYDRSTPVLSKKDQRAIAGELLANTPRDDYRRIQDARDLAARVKANAAKK